MVSPNRLSSVIGSIYDAALEPDRWTGVLPLIAAMFESQQVALNVLDGSGKTVQFITAHGLADSDFALFRAFAATTEDPIWFQTAPADRPSLRSAISDDCDFSRSSYYNEVIRPSGSFYALLAPVMRSQEHHVDLFVAREKGRIDYRAEHIETMQMLAPHVRRAVELGRKLVKGQSLLSAFSHLPFGVMFVDSQLRVIEKNAAAEATLMRPRSPLRVKSGALSSADARSHAQLARAVINACGIRDGLAPGVGADVMIRGVRKGDAAAVDIALSVGPLLSSDSCIPTERCAVVFIQQISLDLPSGFVEQVRTLFDLSPREASIAAALASGRTLKQAAHETQIQMSTARSYLENIFDKTGARQQSQLVALLKSALAIARRTGSDLPPKK
jgi:DNA-binding CsgD family transcriptional regulator